MANRILVVDNAQEVREAMAEWLEIQGHKVITTEDGESGLSLFKQIRPDLVITDYEMPKMDGLEFSKQVRQIWPEAKIIICSGRGDLENKIKQAGYDFFQKGDDLKELKDLINALLTT